MEFGEFLHSLQTPEDIFKSSVSTNNTAKLQSVIDKIVNVNVVVENQLQRRALHLACRHGNVEMITLLIQRGADPTISDALGILPWHMAFNSGLQKVARLVLSNSPITLDGALWNSVEAGQLVHPAFPNAANHYFTFSILKDKKFGLATSLVSTFIKAVVPCTSEQELSQNCEAFMLFYANVDVIIKLYILCGNVITQNFHNVISPHCSDETRKWLTDTRVKPWSLQASCRVAIRRSFRYNTFYSINLLDLPDMMKNYLAFNFDDDYPVNVMPHLPIFQHPWRGVRLADPDAIAYN